MAFMLARYVVGIDLGTTNCVLAYAALDTERPQIEVLKIPQLVSPSTVESQTGLPSFLYLASEHEAVGGVLDLPWSRERRFAVGPYARQKAAEAPERTISAAKSWLCHSRVDRRQPILPWNAPKSVGKISPITASQRYIEHLAAAWNHQFPDAPLADQQLVLTVPASFDAVARELTREAALSAGLNAELVLLEEPQAAVYAWLAAVGERWRRMLKLGDRLLVCDVGGGTTDLTLITVDEDHGDLVLRRLAVGDHLLVGGDNMDLALAHHVAGQFAEQGIQLDPWQSVSLWHSCRAAKERLLTGDNSADTESISLLGRGSRVIGGTVSAALERSCAAELLVEGFFPRCGPDERPRQRRVSGFQEIGLPFESDTAITRHVAAFLGTHAASDSGMELPSHVLFNGGVFKAELLRDRLLEVLSSWRDGNGSPTVLQGAQDYDHAVARGAAYYAWAKKHGGVRIRGGVARSYYIGVEKAGPAIPGAPRPLQALCVVPFGMEEGTAIDVASDEVGLVLGEPTQFRFFSSACRKKDQAGEVLRSWNAGDLVETDALETTLPLETATEESCVPVRFQSRITELGVFELWCVSTQSQGRWKLEFSVRDGGED
jgi:hypothetical protein